MTEHDLVVTMNEIKGYLVNYSNRVKRASDEELYGPALSVTSNHVRMKLGYLVDLHHPDGVVFDKLLVTYLKVVITMLHEWYFMVAIGNTPDTKRFKRDVKKYVGLLVMMLKNRMTELEAIVKTQELEERKSRWEGIKDADTAKAVLKDYKYMSLTKVGTQESRLRSNWWEILSYKEDEVGFLLTVKMCHEGGSTEPFNVYVKLDLINNVSFTNVLPPEMKQMEFVKDLQEATFVRLPVTGTFRDMWWFMEGHIGNESIVLGRRLKPGKGWTTKTIIKIKDIDPRDVVIHKTPNMSEVTHHLSKVTASKFIRPYGEGPWLKVTGRVNKRRFATPGNDAIVLMGETPTGDKREFSIGSVALFYSNTEFSDTPPQAFVIEHDERFRDFLDKAKVGVAVAIVTPYPAETLPQTTVTYKITSVEIDYENIDKSKLHLLKTSECSCLGVSFEAQKTDPVVMTVADIIVFNHFFVK